MLEKSQVKHNNLDYHFFWEYFLLNIKVYIFKVLRKSKMFLHVESIQTLRMDHLCFLQTSFFSTKCAPFLLKIGMDFKIDD
jgi:hypothetical protein